MSVETKKGFIIQELKKNGCRITSQRQLLVPQREYIIRKLKERGCRITRQRLIILDIILQEDCSCCKEIYYRAAKHDPTIGMATVYRLVKTLEEAGLIQRKNMYRIDCTNAVATA